MSILTELPDRMKTVRLVEASKALPELVKKAETEELSYSQFLLSVMTYEQQRRGEKKIEQRLKWAMFPVYQTLADFSLQEQTTLKKQSFNQLADLAWLDQLYWTSVNISDTLNWDDLILASDFL